MQSSSDFGALHALGALQGRLSPPGIAGFPATTPGRQRTMGWDGSGSGSLHVGLLGAGRIAGVHAETLARSREVASVTVYDPVAGAARELAGQFGAGLAASVDELLGLVDAVVVASSTATHAGLVSQA